MTTADASASLATVSNHLQLRAAEPVDALKRGGKRCTMGKAYSTIMSSIRVIEAFWYKQEIIERDQIGDFDANGMLTSTSPWQASLKQSRKTFTRSRLLGSFESIPSPLFAGENQLCPPRLLSPSSYAQAILNHRNTYRLNHSALPLA
jgi:hypothetical protein